MSLIANIESHLKNADAGLLGWANAGNDLVSVFETFASSEASDLDKATAVLQFANNFYHTLGRIIR